VDPAEVFLNPKTRSSQIDHCRAVDLRLKVKEAVSRSNTCRFGVLIVLCILEYPRISRLSEKRESLAVNRRRTPSLGDRYRMSMTMPMLCTQTMPGTTRTDNSD